MNRFQRAMAERAEKIVIKKAIEALQSELDGMQELKVNNLLNIFNSGVVVDVTGLKKTALNLGISFLKGRLKAGNKIR